MAKSPRKAVAQAVNKLTDGLNPNRDVELEEAAEHTRDMLVLLLGREDFDEDSVRRYDSGARVKVKMQRGNSPREQDEWTIVGKGKTAEEARDEFKANLDWYITDGASTVRNVDPYE